MKPVELIGLLLMVSGSTSAFACEFPSLPQHCPLVREGVSVSFGGQTYTESSRFGRGFCSGQLIGHSACEGSCTLGVFHPITQSEPEALFRPGAR